MFSSTWLLSKLIKCLFELDWNLSYILFPLPVHLPTLGQKLNFHLNNSALLHTLLKTVCSSVKASYAKVKREIIKCSVHCFIESLQTNSRHQRFMVNPHTTDIRMAYEYIRVTHGWHTNTYEWYMDDIRVHRSDIVMTYKYIRVTYVWHTNTFEWHTEI